MMLVVRWWGRRFRLGHVSEPRDVARRRHGRVVCQKLVQRLLRVGLERRRRRRGRTQRDRGGASLPLGALDRHVLQASVGCGHGCKTKRLLD